MSKTMTAKDKSTLWVLFLRKSMTLPVMTLYFLANGLSLAEIALLSGISSVIVLLTEFPSGILADRISKKKTILIGLGLELLGIVCFFSPKNLILYSLGTGLISIGTSFLSGSIEAYFMNKNKLEGDAVSLYFSELNQMRIGSNILSGISAILLFFWVEWIPFVIRIVLTLVSIGFFLRVPKENGENTPSAENLSVSRLFAQVFKEVRKHRPMMFLIPISLFFIASVSTIYLYWQPLVSESTSVLSPMWAILIAYLLNSVFQLIGSSLFRWKIAKSKRQNVYFALFFGILAALAFLTSWIQIRILYFIFIPSFFAILSMIGPIRNKIITIDTSPSIRASVLSLYSWVDELGAIGFGFFAAWFLSGSDVAGLCQLSGIGLCISGLLAIIPLFPFKRTFEKKNNS